MNKQSRQRLKDVGLEFSRKKHPSLPENARNVDIHPDSKANGLTKNIINFLKWSGWQAERISVTGRYKDTSIEFTDVVGNRRKVGTGTWLKSSMRKGSADISATIKGRSVKIEVKIKDKLSAEQIEYGEEITQAGGIYIVVRNFDDFLKWYDEFIKNN